MTIISKPFRLQMAKNPWKRGGVYFRGRLAPWIGDVSNLRPRQKEIVARFTSAAHGCKGTKGIEKGVTKMALCIKKSFGK